MSGDRWWGAAPKTMTLLERKERALHFARHRQSRLAELALRDAGDRGRLSNTAPPKYEPVPIQVLTVDEPEQLDLSARRDWEPGAAGGDVLAVGCDWLTFMGYGGELRQDVADLLHDLRNRVEMADPTVVRIAGRDYAIQARGQRPVFRWLLVGPEATIAIRAPKPGKVYGPGDAQVRIELRAVTLWRFGADRACRMWRDAVGELFLRPPERWSVSRIDLAVDVKCDRIPEAAHLVARAQGEAYATGRLGEEWTASLYGGHGRGFTGFRWGTGDVVVRCYRKDREIQIRRKPWVREVWGGYRGEVWRLEVQLRGDVMRELVTDAGPMKGQDPGVWLERAGSIWSHFIGGVGAWCSARARGASDTNRSRWPVHPWWQKFSAATWGGRLLGVVRRPRHVPRRVRLARSAELARQRRTAKRAGDLLDHRTQDDAIRRASLPDAVSRDYSAAAGAVARLAAIVGRDEAMRSMGELVNADAMERATDRIVFGRALDTLTASIGAVVGAGRAYLLKPAA
jgi:hypothetical protein